MSPLRKFRFHPVWPHTRGGRCVVAVVLAAFAALLIVIGSPAHADDTGPAIAIAISISRTL